MTSLRRWFSRFVDRYLGLSATTGSGLPLAHGPVVDQPEMVTPPAPPPLSCEVLGVIELLRQHKGWRRTREQTKVTIALQVYESHFVVYRHKPEPVTITQRDESHDWRSSWIARYGISITIGDHRLAFQPHESEAIYQAVQDHIEKPRQEATTRKLQAKEARIKAAAEPTLAKLRALGCPPKVESDPGDDIKRARQFIETVRDLHTSDETLAKRDATRRSDRA